MRKIVRDGGKVIKVYASAGAAAGRIRLQFSIEELRAIVEEAHQNGLKVAAHAYGEQAMLNAVEARVDSIEHGVGLTNKAAEAIKQNGVYYVPTLHTYFTIEADYPQFFTPLMKQHMETDMVIARDHHLLVVNGTDTIGDKAKPHGQNYKELVVLSRFLGNKETLIAATSRAADCVGLQSIGRIRKGLEADIVIVKGNPLEEIECLAPQNVRHVIKHGKLYSPNAP